MMAKAGPGSSPAEKIASSEEKSGACWMFLVEWWARQDSNLGPTDYESAALTS
jgi:hypothetical protein